MKNRKYKPRKRKPISEISTSKNYSGESSPYWDFMRNRASQFGDLTNEFMEDPLANPDLLSEADSLYSRPLTEIGELQLEATEEVAAKLPLRERQVFDQVAREGKTLAFTSGLLGISISTVQATLNRVRSKMKRRFEALLAAENSCHKNGG